MFQVSLVKIIYLFCLQIHVSYNLWIIHSLHDGPGILLLNFMSKNA